VSIKKLAGQTIWYGLSNIGAKLLNVILTPIVTYLLNSPRGQVDYGDYSVLYSGISFINIIYTYGLETAYFRFSAGKEDPKKLFQTTFTSLICSTFLFSALLIYFRVPLSQFTGLNSHPEYITWCVLIVAIDTLAAIPFAKLRQEERPRKYAFTRVAGILVNIFLTIFFIYYSPDYVTRHPDTAYAHWYSQHSNVGFLILANLAQALLTFFLLYKEWRDFRFRFDPVLWKRILIYSAPMVIVGLGGMVNETIDRLMLRKMLPVAEDAAKTAVGIYSANYKLAIFITLFIQAFRMSAEPFFFSQAADKNAPATYARIMKWFVVTLCLAFLTTALYLDIWKYFIGPAFRSGLGVVPILLAANIALGIYYNLSVWYKITDKMHLGMYITLIGATITLVLNTMFIPRYGMYACAWTTLAAYGSMMVVSYFMGQRYFPVPYDLKKICGYLGLMALLFSLEKGIAAYSESIYLRTGGATLLMMVFLGVLFFNERQELKRIPFLGRFIS
jgi:O-antigen/teichoic acid export membrane protein